MTDAAIKVERREVPVEELRRLRRDVLGLDDVERGMAPPVDERGPPDERPSTDRPEWQGTRRGGRGSGGRP